MNFAPTTAPIHITPHPLFLTFCFFSYFNLQDLSMQMKTNVNIHIQLSPRMFIIHAFLHLDFFPFSFNLSFWGSFHMSTSKSLNPYSGAHYSVLWFVQLVHYCWSLGSFLVFTFSFLPLWTMPELVFVWMPFSQVYL